MKAMFFLSGVGGQTQCLEHSGESLTARPHPQSSCKKMHHNKATTHSCINTGNTSTGRVQEINTANQKHGLIHVNPMVETQVIFKKKAMCHLQKSTIAQ
jgi:hypothetical protein